MTVGGTQRVPIHPLTGAIWGGNLGGHFGGHFGPHFDPPGGGPRGAPGRPRRPPGARARNFPPRNFPPPGLVPGGPRGAPRDPPERGVLGGFPYSKQEPLGGYPQTPKNGQNRGPGKCPILSRLGELLNTLRNVHIFGAPPGGPPPGAPPGPPSGGVPGGVPMGGSPGGPLRMAQTTPPGTPGTPHGIVTPRDTLHVR